MANKIDILVNVKDEASKTMQSIKGSIMNVTTVMAWLVSWVAWYSVKMASDLEQTKIAFTTMTWSAKVADAFIKEMTQFAKTTPFEIWQLETASKQLLAFWFDVREVLPNLKTLWDIAAWVWMDKLPNLILAFWQVRAKTKLMGDDLRQFTEAWVPLLDELAKWFHKSIPEIQQMVSDWKIWFPDVQKALENLTWEWGRFYNMMLNQSTTFGGMISNFKDSINIMLREMAWKFLPQMKEILGQVLDYFQNNWTQIITLSVYTISTILNAFKDWFKGIVQVVWIAYDFMGVTAENSNKKQLISFQWLILAFWIWVESIKTFAKVMWWALTYYFIKAWSEITIAWEKVKLFFKSMASWTMDFIKWVYWSLWFPTDKMEANLKKLENSMWNNANKIIELEKQKQEALNSIREDSYNMAVEWMSKIQKSYEDFTNSQWQTWDSIKSLNEILGEYNWKINAVKDTTKDTAEANKKLKKTQEELQKTISEAKDTVKWYFKDMGSWIDDQKKKLLELKQQYIDINKQIEDQKKTIANIQTWGKQDVAKRAVEIEQQIADIRNKAWTDAIDNASKLAKLNQDILILEQQKSEWNDKTKESTKMSLNAKLDDLKNQRELLQTQWISSDDATKLKSLEKELELAKTYAWSGAIDQARVDSKKTETEILIEQSKIKEEEATKELTRLENLRIAKLDNIKEEAKTYLLLINAKKELDATYFKQFWEHIDTQISKTKEAINYLNELNAKSWWWGGNMTDTWINKIYNTQASWGTWKTNVQVNMWGVQVNNKSDADYLTNTIIDKMTRQLQMFKLWINN